MEILNPHDPHPFAHDLVIGAKQKISKFRDKYLGTIHAGSSYVNYKQIMSKKLFNLKTVNNKHLNANLVVTNVLLSTIQRLLFNARTQLGHFLHSAMTINVRGRLYSFQRWKENYRSKSMFITTQASIYVLLRCCANRKSLHVFRGKPFLAVRTNRVVSRKTEDHHQTIQLTLSQ